VGEDAPAAGPGTADEQFTAEASMRCERLLDRLMPSPDEPPGLAPWEVNLRADLGEAVRQTLLGESLRERPSAGQAFTAWRAAWLEAQAPRLTEAETVKENAVIAGIGSLIFVLALLAFAAAVVALAVGYVAEAVSGALRAWPHWGLLGLWVVPVLAAVTLIPLVTLDDALLRRTNRGRLERKRLLAAEREATAGRAFDEELRKALSARARIAVDAAKDEAPEHLLLVKRWSGLDEDDEDAYRIQTPAARELAARIAEVGSGSIGLVGPPGGGKTTLLRQYCFKAKGSAGDAKDLAFMVPVPAGYAASDFLVPLFSELCRSYLELREGPGALVPGSAPPEPARSGRRGRARPVTAAQGPLLARQARQHLTGLQLVSPSSAALPAATPVPSARHATSYPELAATFRGFLTQVSREVHGQGGRVFIGIDEADKMGPRAARQFASELRLAFGIPHTFYLVAMPEDMLAGHEPGRLPARDASSSALETQILVGNLDFSAAQALLSRRWPGISTPYAWLCHCLSGGLPAGLVSSCVQVVRIGQRLGQDALIDKITQVAITEALAQKANVMMRSWTGSAPDDDARELAYRIQGLTAAGAVGIHALRGLAHWAREHHRDAATAWPGGYIYLWLTLLEVFGPALDVQRMQEGQAALETLASARRTLDADAQLAWRTISEFRSAWHLGPISQPHAPRALASTTLDQGPGPAAAAPVPDPPSTPSPPGGN
jgi:hypothetical protein